MQVAAFFLTKGSLSFKQFRILGKISASTTTSASSTACFEIWARQLHTCLFSYASLSLISEAKNGTAPASTTLYANMGECLQISLRALAEILLREISCS